MSKTTKIVTHYLVILLITLLIPCSVFANKASVRIEAPDQTAVGDDVKIVVHVSHEGNNFIHYTNLVTLKINGEETKRWEFSAFKRPESENFTREITYTVKGPFKISAEANCNIHGSAAIIEKSVNVQ